MKPRLLVQIEAAIAAEPPGVAADCKQAERASLLARLGQHAEARAVIAALHAKYAAQPQLSVSAWLSFTESLLSFFTDLSRAARGKMHRAHTLSSAFRDAKVHAMSAAWLANMAYEDMDFEAMASHVVDVFQLTQDDHLGARAGACLVTAKAYHFAGHFDRAQPWYALARQNAAASAEELTLGGVMLSMAKLLTCEARQIALRGEPDALSTRRARSVAESTGNFDALIGTSALNALVPLLHAQVNSIQGHWSAAVALYEARFNDGLLQGMDRMRAWLGADLAWCRLQLGQTEQALKDALAAEVAVANDHDADDRAAAHSRIAQVLSQLGHADSAARHREQAAIDWLAHEQMQARALALIDQALASGPHPAS